MHIFPLLMEKQYRESGISADQLAKFTHAEKDLVGKSLQTSLSPTEILRHRYPWQIPLTS